MLKNASSVVLASLFPCDAPFTRCIRQSNGSPVRLGYSLAAALLGGLFEHPDG
jgi:hypothetical protein